MKRIAKHYSGIRFTRASVAMGLTALLCMPLQASAEESTSTAPVAQAVQQSRTVKGQVVDEMGEPMIGVTVRVKGTGKGTITDMDGRFSIQAESNATLEISFVGYKTQTFKASKTNYQLKMELDNTGLDEVVVIGYGTQKKRDLTGAITSIKSEDITAAPLPNPIESLQGKVAGLDITRSSGQAGAASSIKLRGTRSLTASEGGNDAPLVLVDGLPGSLSTLNANDIESIEVLKDAASTAVYGSS